MRNAAAWLSVRVGSVHMCVLFCFGVCIAHSTGFVLGLVVIWVGFMVWVGFDVCLGLGLVCNGMISSLGRVVVRVVEQQLASGSEEEADNESENYIEDTSRNIELGQYFS